jgi:hypothetical protein
VFLFNKVALQVETASAMPPLEGGCSALSLDLLARVLGISQIDPAFISQHQAVSGPGH